MSGSRGRLRSTILAVSLASGLTAQAQTGPAPRFDERWFAAISTIQSVECTLSTYAYHESVESNENFYLYFTWTPDKPLRLGASRYLEAPLTARLTALGTADAWEVRLNGISLLLEGADAAKALDDVKLGHAIELGVRQDGRVRRFLTRSAREAVAVPMFEACVASLTHAPPRASTGDFIAVAAGDDSCTIARTYDLDRYRVGVRIEALANGGEVTLEEQMGGTAHRPWLPKDPTHFEPQQLFGKTMDVRRNATYGINPEDVDALVADLDRGMPRKFTTSLPREPAATHDFGGDIMRAPAAMFEACRRAMFPARAAGVPTLGRQASSD